MLFNFLSTKKIGENSTEAFASTQLNRALGNQRWVETGRGIRLNDGNQGCLNLIGVPSESTATDATSKKSGKEHWRYTEEVNSSGHRNFAAKSRCLSNSEA